MGEDLEDVKDAKLQVGLLVSVVVIVGVFLFRAFL
jgi:hypothetical protein